MILQITCWLLLVTALVIFIKLTYKTSIWEYILALNLTSAKIVLFLVTYGIFTNDHFFLDIALTFALIEFLGVSLISMFIAQGGNHI